jgi:NAD-dependent SIR2 family protein deacetylase/uncharacterized protein YegL
MLTLSYDLSHELVSLGSSSHLYVLVRIKAPAVEMKKRRLLNLGLVLDRSGSMEGAKLDYVRHASRFLVSQLSSEDILSIVTFHSAVEVLSQAGPVRNKEELKGLISAIRTAGSTNLSGGWLAGANEVLKSFSKERLNRLVLLTDGCANEGITEHPALMTIAQDLDAKGVSTTSIGFGADINEDLMRGIADAGKGNYYFIDSPEKAPSTFAAELSELLSLFAQNLTLTISPSSQVAFVGVHHDFKAVQKGSEITLSLGDIFAGDERAVLLEFVTPKSDSRGETGVTVLNLSYQQVYEEVVFREVSAFVKVGYGSDEEVAKQRINPVVHRELILCQSIQARQQAVKDADLGDLKSAQSRLQKSIDSIRESEYKDDDMFREEVKTLEGLTRKFDDASSYQSIGRKEALYQSVSISKKKSYASVSISSSLQWAVIERLKTARSVTAITGFMLANELSIPGVRGVTAKRGDEEVQIFTEKTFSEMPDLFWETVTELRNSLITMDVPECYRIFPEMEEFWSDFMLVTENVDGMHSFAGCTKQIELYGNIFRNICSVEKKVIERPTDHMAENRCPCGARLRPDVLWLGEEFEQAMADLVKDRLTNSEVIIIIGSDFHRQTEFLEEAKKAKRLVVELNGPSPLLKNIALCSIKKPIAVALPEFWKDILR